MNYTHLTIEERTCLRKYYVEEKSYREIARLLGRNVSTILREIARNYTHKYDINTYYPHTAHKKYLFRRSFWMNYTIKCSSLTIHSNAKIPPYTVKARKTAKPPRIPNRKRHGTRRKF